ncbi:MAG: hypothetical protein RQ864_02940 [Lutibacter sp.]|nr:hypothetical protein [Lutibacter sp.]MDT8416743.1 hypothetical protein [Lutibacter sp.]
MKMIKLFAVLIFGGLLWVSCSKDDVVSSEAQTDVKDVLFSKGNEAPSGAHYNLNIIGVKEKTMNDIAAGNVIFVNLFGESDINLQEGDYAVLDKNGTDEDGALFQLPAPGIEPYITELPYGFDTTTDYSVYARPLGKPLTGATITTMADLSDIGDAIIDNKESRLWDNINSKYDVTSFTWGDFVPNPVKFERLKGKSTFQNVTAQLLTVVYEVDVLYDDDDDPLTADLELTFHVRIPIFDEMLEGEYWKYDNRGLKLLQVRFYPFGTDVTYDDLANGWDEL